MYGDFDERSPIWRQLVSRLEDSVLEGRVPEGEAYPSVRTLASELGLNPQTILKAFDELRARGLADKRRGEGLFVAEGARERLLAERRERLLSEELPALVARARSLGLDLGRLLEAAKESAGTAGRKAPPERKTR